MNQTGNKSGFNMESCLVKFDINLFVEFTPTNNRIDNTCAIFGFFLYFLFFLLKVCFYFSIISISYACATNLLKIC